MSAVKFDVKTYATGGAHSLHLLRASGRSLAAGCPVLLLHGSTLPGSIAFAIAFDGSSWLDDLARRGFDVWTLDIRGYGGSWKPDAGEIRPCEPVADTRQAVDDVATAISFICATSGATTIDLVGWSWGATVAATFVAGGGECRRLVLHAPQWLRDTPSPMVTAQTMTEPYRTVDGAVFVERWLARVAPAARPQMESWRQALEQALADHTPIIVPNGSARDIAKHWMAGVPGFDPAAITVPTLVVVGAADTDTSPALAREVFARLGGLENLYVEIPDGTHFTLFEPARDDLFCTIGAFLAADTPYQQEISR